MRIRDGCWWVASNTDLTIPTSYGVAPGHGVLVDTLRRYSGVEPVVAGKPARPLFDETVRRVGGERPLMVGDRLDTDIAGANDAGVDSLLVLTGVTTLEDLAAARAARAPDVRRPGPGRPARRRTRAPSRDGAMRPRAAAGGPPSTAERLRVTGAGRSADWWRAVADAAWRSPTSAGRVRTLRTRAARSPS